jgi:cytohesin
MNEQAEQLVNALGLSDENEKVRSLLEEEVDPNLQLGEDNDNAYLIHLAVLEGTRDNIRALLDKGADPHVRDKYGKTPLHSLARRCGESMRLTYPDIVEMLLDKGLDPNAQQTDGSGLGSSGKGETPLHKAVQSRDDSTAEVVEILLQHGADPCIRNEDEETPLHLASGGRITDSLLEQGADPNAKNWAGETPLHYASQEKPGSDADAEKVSALLEKGADPSLSCHVDDYSVESDEGDTPMHVAAGDGNVEIARALLEAGADPDVDNKAGVRPIQKAAGGGWLDTVELLLDAGATADTRDEMGRTPLHEAASAEEEEEDGFSVDEQESGPQNNPEGTIQVLVEAGVDVNAQQKAKESSPLVDLAPDQLEDFEGKGDTPLHCAASASTYGFSGPSGFVQNVEVLLESGAEVNARNAANQTPLHLAAESGNTEVVKILIQAGAELDLQQTKDVGFSGEGDTPILKAVDEANLETILALAEAGADLELASADGYTPLGRAVESKEIEIASLLLDEGADPNAPTPTGTPLNEILLEGGSEDGEIDEEDLELMRLLLEHGADPNVQSGEKYAAGGTHQTDSAHQIDPVDSCPLHLAAAVGTVEVVELLLDHGADPTVVYEENGKTAVEVAEEEGEPEVEELLHSHIGS